MYYKANHGKKTNLSQTCLAKNDTMTNTVIREDPIRKIPLDRP